jgi:hypothetical protein
MSTIQDLSIEDARSILRTGIEGGINYWLGDGIQIKTELSEGWGSEDSNLWWYEKLSFKSNCMEVGLISYEITPKSMIKKYPEWMKFCKEKMEWRYQEWVEALKENDLAAHCDAEDADCFIQFCCFNEVVFG